MYDDGWSGNDTRTDGWMEYTVDIVMYLAVVSKPAAFTVVSLCNGHR